MSGRFDEVYRDVKNKFFVVYAPVALRDGEIAHDSGIYLDTDRGGNPIKYNPARMDVFGLSVVKMAEGYANGLGFRLYDSRELPRLMEIMEKYVEATNIARRSINFRKASTDEIEMIYNFATNVVALNSSLRTTVDVEFKKDVGSAIRSSGVEVVPEMERLRKDSSSRSRVIKTKIKRFSPVRK